MRNSLSVGSLFVLATFVSLAGCSGAMPSLPATSTQTVSPFPASRKGAPTGPWARHHGKVSLDGIMLRCHTC